MEKLNNGCEYCGKGKYLKEGFYIQKLDDGSYIIDVDELKDEIYIDYCPKCGRNLKTGNQIIEVKPLEFPSWEEFNKHPINEIYNYHFLGGIICMRKEFYSKTIEIGSNPIITKYIKKDRFEITKQGYKKACGEIERIRLGFIIELCKG